MNTHNYGFSFNTIEINENVLSKSAKNDYGKKRIKNEINFYKNIIENNINLSIPDIYILDISNSIIKMEYLNGYQTLTHVFYDKDNNYRSNIINTLIQKINILHKFITIPVNIDLYIENIMIETSTKLIERYNSNNWENIEYFNRIKSINGLKFRDMYYYINIINTKIIKIVEKMEKHDFVLIHGDIHLGNILINNENNICFIDPRGYFGKTELYGVKEYDYAKLLFGISGYSKFDEMCFNNIIIDNNGDFYVDFINNFCSIYEEDIFDDFTKLLSLTIWLSNNSTFIDTNKKVTSLLISYYLCEKFLPIIP